MGELKIDSRKRALADYSVDTLKSKNRLLNQWGDEVTADKVKEAGKMLAASEERRKSGDPERVWVSGEVVAPSKSIESMRRQLLASHCIPMGQDKA